VSGGGPLFPRGKQELGREGRGGDAAIRGCLKHGFSKLGLRRVFKAMELFGGGNGNLRGGITIKYCVLTRWEKFWTFGRPG